MNNFIVAVLFCVAVSCSYGQTGDFDVGKFMEKANKAKTECADKKDACMIQCSFEKMEWLDSSKKLKTEIMSAVTKITDDMLSKLPDDQKACATTLKNCLANKGPAVDGSKTDCSGFTDMYNCLKPIMDKSS